MISADEKFVRENWDGARFESVFENSRAWLHKPQVELPRNRGRVLCDRPNGGVWILSGNANTLFEISKALSEDASWAAAAEFTRNRLNKITLFTWDLEWANEHHASDTLVALIEEKLEELKKGMR